MFAMNHTIYAPRTAAFDGSARALTDDEMRRAAPSIFAVEAHASRSERFAPIPTIEVLRGLQKEGFAPVAVRQSRSRDDSKYDFTKHIIRLRRLDDARAYQVGDTICEIILKNANDGTSAYDLMAGLFRIRCKNSLVAQTATIDSVKVRHSGDAIGKVIEGTYRVLGEAENILAAPQDWGNVKLPYEAKAALAESAHILRFADAEGKVATPIQPAQLLAPRRADDTAGDLWTTFNVIQENVIRGGLSARAPATTDERGRRRRGRMVTTREINGIDQDVKLNKALWVLGERMAQLLKSAA
ncbi:hypothetical protein SS37A_38450 (plasmid) [Methylocystis iwaonis]|uniref:DUF945 domain-containing protein n=2 Tax=Methylocystis iwaonis TaxID=2885079 RepID=A0ABN6VKQ2_9HYPH|nr:hypothetical protein SS37A_38450 [Methylocystis iwaonis]